MDAFQNFTFLKLVHWTTNKKIENLNILRSTTHQSTLKKIENTALPKKTKKWNVPGHIKKLFQKLLPKMNLKVQKLLNTNLSLQTLDLWVPKINKNNDFWENCYYKMFWKTNSNNSKMKFHNLYCLPFFSYVIQLFVPEMILQSVKIRLQKRMCIPSIRGPGRDRHFFFFLE